MWPFPAPSVTFERDDQTSLFFVNTPMACAGFTHTALKAQNKHIYIIV
jgi:hypothetical protein